jgi:competence protein ComEC
VRPRSIRVAWPGPVRLWLAVAAGHLASSFAPLPSLLWPATLYASLALGAASLACVAGSARARFPARRRLAALEAAFGIASAALAGASLGAEADRAAAVLPVHPRETEVEVEGLVLDTTAGDAEPGAVLFEVRRVRVADRGVSCRARVVMRWRGDAIPPRWLLPGLWLRASGSFRPPEDARNEGTDAPGRRMERARVSGTLTVDPRSVLAPPDPPERGGGWAALIRDRIARRFSDELSRPVAALARGMMLGDRSGIAPGVTDSFRAGGTIHVLSISGLHVCIFAGFAALAAAALRMPVRPAMLFELAVLWGYVLLVGAPASALRSGMLWTAMRSGRVLGRAVRPFTAWGLAGLVLHLADPSLALAPGFQLSFTAVLGIGAAGALRPRAAAGASPSGWRGRLAGAVGLASQGLGAEAGTATLQARMFGALPLIGIGLNLAVVPLCTLFLAEAVLFLVLHAVPLAWLGAASSGALEATGDVLLAVNAWGSKLIRPWVVPSAPSAIAVGIAGVALLAAWGRAEAARADRPRASAVPWSLAAIALALALAVAGSAIGPSRDSQHVTMIAIDVGQGDATWVELPHGASVLVDGGPADDRRDAGAWAVEPVLRAERARRPITVLLSHAHLDHFGGLGWVAERGWIGALVENGSDPGGAWRRRITAGVRRAGGRVSVVASDTALDLGGSVAGLRRVPDAAGSLHENDRSLAAIVRAGACSILLPGDLEAAGEAALLDRLGPVDVLKAPHHGSATSSTHAWVERIAPRLVTVSVGERNRFGHPSPAVLGRYERAGALVLRTDREGGIRITLTPTGGWVSTRAHPEPIFVPWSRPSPEGASPPGH